MYVAAVCATTDCFVGPSFSPRKEAQGRLVAAGVALWGPAPGTSHPLYLGLLSFIAEWLLCVSHNAVTAVGQPGARTPKQGADSHWHIPGG